MKETNMEHYRDEIEAAEYDFALINGEVKSCRSTTCSKCDFDTAMGCCTTIIKWLMSEYKPEPVLTEREKHFVEFAQEGWLARDKRGYAYVYQEKPFKHEDVWSVANPKKCAVLTGFQGDMFPFITWEDEEPWAVSYLRKLEVKE